MRIFALILSVTLAFSCDRTVDEPVTENSENCFPTIIVETKSDSVEIGELFEAKVYLSDTSYFYLTDYETGKKQSVFPVFRINGELKESPDGYFYQYSEVVTNESVYQELPTVREVSFGIIMPHPEPLGGDVEFGYRYSFIAIESAKDAK